MKHINLIAACSQNGVIGISKNGVGTIPWNYPADIKQLTSGTVGNESTVIMGRKTFESIGRILPNRRNIVVSQTTCPVPGITTASSLQEAIDLSTDTVWLIGGASIYHEGMQYCHGIYLTIVPDMVCTAQPGTVMFPWINPLVFVAFAPDNETIQDGLTNLRYIRR